MTRRRAERTGVDMNRGADRHPHPSAEPPRVSGDYASWSLGRLPDLAWRQILKRLGYRDRVRVAQVWPSLLLLCAAPEFWENLTLFVGRPTPWQFCNFAFYPEGDLHPEDVDLLQWFSHRVRRVTLYLHSLMQEMEVDRGCLSLMGDVCRRWQLTHLHIIPTSLPHSPYIDFPRSCDRLLTRLLTSPQINSLQHLTVLCCRYFRENVRRPRCSSSASYTRGSVLFRRLRRLRNKSLTTLSLFSVHEHMWSNVSRKEPATFVRQLVALRDLAIHSEFLTDRMLYSLQCVQGLSSLTIHYEFWKEVGRNGPLRKTAARYWSNLNAAHPSMTVAIVISVEVDARVSVLSSFLPPPVARVETCEVLEKTREWTDGTLADLLDLLNYPTLTSLSLLVDSLKDDAMASLLDLLTRCPGLLSLTVWGDLDLDEEKKKNNTEPLVKLTRDWRVLRLGSRKRRPAQDVYCSHPADTLDHGDQRLSKMRVSFLDVDHCLAAHRRCWVESA